MSRLLTFYKTIKQFDALEARSHQSGAHLFFFSQFLNKLKLNQQRNG